MQNMLLMTFMFWKRRHKCFVNVYDMSLLQYLSKTFTCSSKVTVPFYRRGLVNVTFPSPLQYINDSLSKPLISAKVMKSDNEKPAELRTLPNNLNTLVPIMKQGQVNKIGSIFYIYVS